MQLRAADPASCAGVFNFMAAATSPSLYRTGRVLITRDPDGNTGEARGIELEAHTLTVHDARAADAARLDCEHNGFELREAPVDGAIDFHDHADVVRRYYPQCAALVAAATGGRAYAFDHNVRSAGGKEDQRRISGGQDVQGPAHVVHGDYTLQAAPDRLRQLAEPPAGNDTLTGYLGDGASLIRPGDAERALGSGGRFAIINVWRNIADEPVATHPLALCDARTVTPEDLVVFEIHYPNRIGENYFARYSARHRMHYYPAMTPEEALLIKQWDSAGPLARSGGDIGDAAEGGPCTFSFHSAFDDPATPPDAPDRWSIEVRCLVLYG